MGIATFADYRAAYLTPRQTLFQDKTSITAVQGLVYSLWQAAPGGVKPSAAVVPTAATTGAIPWLQNGGTKRLLSIEGTGINLGTWILIDRLSHQAGLSGTVTGPQTTNLPTAALTRYTDGVGVMAALEIYNGLSTSGTTATISYTDDAGNTGQTSPAFPFGVTNFALFNRFVTVPLLAGDKGVRAVASVDLAVSSGSAGDFGVTLFKPLAMFHQRPIGYDLEQSQLFACANIPVIQDDACLAWLCIPNSSSSGLIQATLRIADD